MAVDSQAPRLTSRGLPEYARLLKPAAQAYTLGLLSTTAPKLLSVLITTATGKLSARDAAAKLRLLFARQLQLDKFAATCGVLVGGSTVLPVPLLSLLDRYQKSTRRFSPIQLQRLVLIIRFLCAAFAAAVSFDLLNNKEPSRARYQQDTRGRRRSSVTFHPQGAIQQLPPPPPARLAGRTLDLTLFGAVRALDVVISSSWSAYRRRPKRTDKFHRAANISEQYVSPAIFAFSSCVIMWTWFYTPERLPRSYNNWINSAAQIDSRLIEALRACRFGTFVYGKDTGWAPLLSGLCRELGMPEVWGDPALTRPVPCELYHCGIGRNCEWHGLVRLARAFKFAMQMYLPLNLVLLVRRKPTQRSVVQAFTGAARSSAFLAGFVALFYYGVCFTRSRAVHLLPRKYVSDQDIDGGLCVGTGCFACGWSILLENPARRNEISFFVAPRALATLFPRRYDKQHLWRERIAFIVSASVILTAAQTDPKRVRGVFGRLLGQILG